MDECLGLDFDAIGAALGAGEPFRPEPHLVRGNANLRLAEELVLKYEPALLTRMSGLVQAIFQVASKLPVVGR